MKTLIAFNGDEKLKAAVLAEIENHRRADMIAQGTYGEGEGSEWRGCAVGCTIRSLGLVESGPSEEIDRLIFNNHQAYEDKLGIPVVLAYLEDRLFERMPVEMAREWPGRFISAIPVGADLSLVLPRLRYWQLVDETDGVLKFASRDQTKEVINELAGMYLRWINGDKPRTSEWELIAAKALKARNDAYAYAYTSASAYADTYADASASAYAYASAYASASTSAYADAYADAFASAYAFADAYALMRGRYEAARKAAYIRTADKLVELMEAAK